MLLTTPELQVGDVVMCHSMVCQIDRAIHLSRSHPGESTFYTDAKVLNRSQVPACAVPYSFTQRDMSERSDEDWPHRWTIQGNELACWSVHRAEPSPVDPRQPREVPASA